MAAVDTDTVSMSSPPPVRPPPLTQSDAITSLLSLSIAAADGAALPIPPEHPPPGSGVAQSLGAASSMLAPSTMNAVSTSAGVGAAASSVGKHHRRLGSMKTKRRLSDAREASVRPMYVFSFFSFFLSLPLFFLRRMFIAFLFVFLVFVSFWLWSLVPRRWPSFFVHNSMSCCSTLHLSCPSCLTLFPPLGQ
ncbi:hypothetical protein M413DRAFT_382763 [Hebeloma cylindrosporum]|uniref:Uncharacterized protein n=1 Tax=Hebeloma cylindrosporum TaxID=76867 RepID=A0A0C3CH80_HEBCY|nr:hypothetical protein M413DRAFT_382763 [Hebeloma cylindrosporum h7]